MAIIKKVKIQFSMKVYITFSIVVRRFDIALMMKDANLKSPFNTSLS